MALISIYYAYKAVIQPLLQERIAKTKNIKLLKTTLLSELWQNMNFAHQIERSYFNNINSKGGLFHYPKFSVRYSILELIINFNNVNLLQEFVNSKSILEIYAQIKMIDTEFQNWRNLFPQLVQANEMDLYKLISVNMIELVDVFMRNSMDLWFELLNDYSIVSEYGDRRMIQVSKDLKNMYNNGKWVTSTYKSSFFKIETNRPAKKFDAIVCWEDDWKNSEFEVIELKNLIPLHESWVNDKV